MLYDDMQALIGHTPMLRLQRSGLPSALQGFAKLELWNPAGSVKDRIGVAMIAAAERDGKLQPGGTIVEATAGNTGLGIAFAALGRGYDLIFVVPTKFSQEKQCLMRALGAKIINTPMEGGMLGAAKKAEELRAQIPGAVCLAQFTNPANPQAHYESTGPEVWRDMAGDLDYCIAGAGSGGTFSGVLRYLKEQNPRIRGVLADPVGSVIGGGGDHQDYDIEGIGNDFVAETMDLTLVDQVFKIRDDEAVDAARRLARDEGIIAGSSSGAAMAALQKLAKSGASGKAVVILPDRGDRYFSKNLLP